MRPVHITAMALLGVASLMSTNSGCWLNRQSAGTEQRILVLLDYWMALECDPRIMYAHAQQVYSSSDQAQKQDLDLSAEAVCAGGTWMPCP